MTPEHAELVADIRAIYAHMPEAAAIAEKIESEKG